MANIKMDSLEGMSEPLIITDENGREYELEIECEIENEDGEVYILTTVFDDIDEDDNRNFVVLKNITEEDMGIVNDKEIIDQVISIYNEYKDAGNTTK